MVAATKGKKVHEAPIALLHDDVVDADAYKRGLSEARLWNLAVAPLRPLSAEMRGRFDVVLVLLSHLDATRESILKQIVDLQQQSGGAVLVIAQRMDARATISVLQLGVEAVLSGDLPMRRLYRRIAFHLQRQRARPIHVAALTASPTV
ncbi:MAG: hypothetical protein ACK50Q_09890 [Labrys sp. (in: a-proteobacteria)]|jgi:DNA-binding response OmpR family regulator